MTMGFRQYRYHIAHKPRGPRDFAVYLGEKFPDVYLTKRETQCCLLLLQGYTMRSIGIELGLSARTIEYYLNNIKKKLDCKRRDQLVFKLLDSAFIENLQKKQLH